jgi:pimeloyl-ACP methyl ester carboxylesterase
MLCEQLPAGGMLVKAAFAIESFLRQVWDNANVFILIFLCSSVMLYIAIVILAAHSEMMQRGLMFLTWTKIFTRTDQLQNLKYQGLSVNTRNIHIETEDGVQLHGYHMAPARLSTKLAQYKVSETGAKRQRQALDEAFDRELASAKIVFIYMHGIALTRAFHYRLATMTNLANQFDAHCIAFDYRGFGDVKGTTTEDGTRRDARAINAWVEAAFRRGLSLKDDGVSRHIPVKILYGHSLGASIATFLAADKSQSSVGSFGFGGLILNGAFNCADDAMECSKLSALLRVFPPVFRYVQSRFRKAADGYRTQDVIEHVPADLPVLFIHGTADAVVPIKLGLRLFSKWSKLREGSGARCASIDFIEIEKAMHSDNFKFHEWTTSISRFLSKNVNF